MSDQKAGVVSPCPKCGGQVEVMADSGGALGEATTYAAHCFGCRSRWGGLGSRFTGRKRDAIREWNHHVKNETVGEPDDQ